MPEISIIIPVHNAEKYLPECIRSLRGQTCQDIELIFVDDRSEDASLSILREAEQTDSRIRVLSFPKNRGVSAARNAGIDIAQGRFIGFCDADDWVEPDMYSRLLTACLDQHADASFCRVFKNMPSRQVNVPLGFDTGTCFDAHAIRHTLIPAMLALPKDGDGQPLSGYSPRNLFARELLGNLRFREDIHYAEDLLFIIMAYLKAGRVTAVDEAYYHYRFYEASVTKHYSPYVPDSPQKSNDAIEALLAGIPECASRMEIRKRKMTVDAVRNCCAKQTPYSFMARVGWIRGYMNQQQNRKLFQNFSLRGLNGRTAVRLGLMKYRLAFLSALLYSTVFQYKV
ncbi:MAG: glycosyltransferase family 2 protein [Clostridia bacterium]|nr:glycosyltransferase family 2 protein [Clostridia bacterium]